MQNTRDLKRRIKSIGNTQQITSAMKMVAASKLRRLQGALQAVLPYEKKLLQVMDHLNQGQISHSFLEPREVKRIAYLIIGGDQGLCGGFNNAINRFGEEKLQESPHPLSLVIIGSRAKHYFEKRGWEIHQDYTHIADNPDYLVGRVIGEALSKLFLKGEVDEVQLIYTAFESVSNQKPVMTQLLPVPQIPPQEGDLHDYLFEPDGAAILEVVLPQYIQLTAYTALLQSKASEMGARMAAMSAATDNAEELIDDLTLVLNRARQAAITTEISEIVGGAAALS